MVDGLGFNESYGDFFFFGKVCLKGISLYAIDVWRDSECASQLGVGVGLRKQGGNQG